MTIKPDRIESQIVSELRSIEARWQKSYPSPRDCTRRIKNCLGDLGKSLGYVVYCCQCKYRRNGEWLFDLTWINETNSTFKSLALAFESEWDPSQAMDDFEKLLVARAEHRMMIFSSKTPERAEKLIRGMIKEINSFDLTKKGDRYLFACWIEKEKEYFDTRLFVAGEKIAINL